jgi:VanZ family protein
MMKDDKRDLLVAAARILLCVATLFILYEATIKQPMEVHLENGDKLLHALAFLALGFLVDFAFPDSGYGIRKVLPLMALGILIELVQSFLPWRSADIMDFLADCLGVGAYWVSWPILRKIPLFRRRWAG